jgi:hypothetical protein
MTYAITPSGRIKRSNSSLPWWLWLAPALLLPLAIGGPNTDLGLYSIAVLALGVPLLWRPGEPPILLFIFLYQWMQSATGALYGNAIGVPLMDLHVYRGEHEFAAGLMLTGTLVLALAMRAVAGRPVRHLHTRIVGLLSARPFGFWLRVYAVAWVFGATCAALASFAGGLRQPLLALSGIKWAAFVLLTFAAFAVPNRGGPKAWMMVFAFEFALSIGGFFASFKDVFLYSLFGIATCNVRIGGRTLLVGAVLGVAMISVGVIWTAIKMDYRSFANEGSRQQVVIVDYSARIAEIGRLLGELNEGKLKAATGDFFERLMYHQFFGAAATNVPNIIPYAGGEIWGEAILRPFMPRLFFPDKREINDSDLTNEYTELGVSTAEQGTSISLGYMAEAYIDFGPVLMFAAVAGLGAGLGYFYRWLLGQPGPLVVIGAALAPFALMPAHLAETSILKLGSTFFLSIIACVVTLKILSPMLLRRMAASTRAPVGEAGGKVRPIK